MHDQPSLAETSSENLDELLRAYESPLETHKARIANMVDLREAVMEASADGRTIERDVTKDTSRSVVARLDRCSPSAPTFAAELMLMAAAYLKDGPASSRYGDQYLDNAALSRGDYGEDLTHGIVLDITAQPVTGRSYTDRVAIMLDPESFLVSVPNGTDEPYACEVIGPNQKRFSRIVEQFNMVLTPPPETEPSPAY